MLLAVSMAINLIKIPDKYLKILSWNMIFFIQKKQFCVFFQIILKYVGFSILIKTVARECVTMVTNHTVSS